MMIKGKSIVAIIACASVLCACAKEKSESDRSIQEKILDAYISQYCPNATKLASGLTIISETDGYGDTKPEDGYGCWIHYSTYSLEGVCQSTTDSVKAKLLGTYSASIYYGPTLFLMNSSGITAGMKELLGRMTEGGEVLAIIPPWLTVSSTNYYGGISTSGTQASVNTIYKVKMGKMTDDIVSFQIDSLESYSAKYFSPKIDSVEYGVYFRNYTHPDGIADEDTVKADKTVNIWYIGRLLDGYVFDTNIKDTAKKYDIYDSSNDYDPLSITMEETADDMTSSSDDSSSGVVAGFAKALKRMTYLDQAVTFFVSGYGYGEEGNMSSGVGVPEYSMLRFDIWMATSKDDDYPPTLEPEPDDDEDDE